jgi:signal transduction histidine kinase/ligand-binding sensor domain-containing protein
MLACLIRARVAVGAALLLALANGAEAASSAWLARDWQSDDGLPDNSITGLAQTSDGFLWVGSAGGLMRFDGVRFQEWPLVNLKGVPNRVVRTVCLDRRGRLWVAMDRGPVVRLEPGAARVFAEGMPDSRATVMADDADGSIWIAYANGTLVHLGDQQVKILGAREGLPDAGLCMVATDASGRVWFAKGTRVGVMREGNLVTLATLPHSIDGLGAARSNGVWIASGSQLFQFDGEGQPVMRVGGLAEPDGQVPKVLIEDARGTVWLGTSASGVFRFADGRLEEVPTSHHSVTCLLGDREGNVWVGTAGGGLNRLRPRAVELIGTRSGLPFESVMSACEDAEGALWAVTQNGLLARSSSNAWSLVSKDANWPGGFAVCVTCDREGDIWVGTFGRGMFRLHAGKWTAFRQSDGLAGDRVRSLLAAANGDLWIATDSPPQLQRMRAGRIEVMDLPSSSRTIRAMAEDQTGVIWVGSADGQLFRIHEGVIENLAPRLSERLLSIRCLQATPDGALWIGYAGWGVGRLKGDAFRRITTEEGLHDDYVSQIVADEQGWLWCAGNRGIFQVRMDQMAAVAEGRAERVRPIAHGRGEGLHNLQPNFENFPGALRDRKGRIWFAMRTGLAVVHSTKLPHNDLPPPVLVDSVSVDNQRLAIYDGHSPLRAPPTNKVVDLRSADAVLRLAPRHRKIDIEFTALSFTAPENVRVQYQLENVDEGWVTVEADKPRSASYARLPAGEYRFRVKACNNDGVWNEQGASLRLVVAPFFYNTWWFRLLLLAAFTASVIGVVRYVSFRRLRAQLLVLEQQNALHRERARIAKDIHDDLGASLTQIAFLGELAQQDRAEPEKASERVERISLTARQAVKSLDEIVWAVNPRNDTLAHLIDYAAQHALDYLRVAGVRCRLDLPEQVPVHEVSTDIRHNLFLAMKEALTNIAKHAQATEVWLRVKIADAALVVIIEDNGRGFSARSDAPGADGLRNMDQRLAAIGGTCEIESEPGTGTRVRMQVPWPKG